ncbi:LysR family transcriptional regulator [Bacillus sp. BRMEA1]|uniref:LysR family transcriptional regulator n=1 Tax=Neobacillus endophyticus TaxID=2738405 RepID=UPI0015640051|nr:LysR family transcriptional regulator [Neobacillus endophyticus]NRD78275.1 LysR family transcriptional regulator [Neobacillus endophyticus]
MEIREILYVKTVADFKNLTKAAEYLNITQPSLSQSIKSIEDRLNTPLFIRSKRGMELTQTGMKFVRDSTLLLSEYKLFISKLKNYSKEEALSHSIGLYKLSYTTPINDAIMSFISGNSKDNYIIKVESNENLEMMLLSNQLDLAIIKYTPISKRQSKLSYDVLFKEKLYVLMSQSNPLASYDKISVRSLEGNKLITSDINEYPYIMTHEVLKNAGIDLEVHTYTNYSNLSMILDLVEKDMGIAFATKDVCTYFDRKRITYVPLIEDYFYDICIVQNEMDKRSGKNNVLINYIYHFLGLNLETHHD